MAASLSSRLALVTGGGAGIGKAVAQALAASGACCIVADVCLDNAKKVERSLPVLTTGLHCALPVNVADSESVSALFAKIKELNLGPANIIVNCAGITRDSLMLDMGEDQFNQVIDVNLKGTFLVTRLAAKDMVANNTPGSIINISSIVGKTGNVGQTNYAASKAGVIGLTKSAAKELAKFNIRCNAVMPGFIDTSMVKTVPEQILDGITRLTPLRRMGKPDEVAEVIRFLASDESSYVTGTVVEVTGGLFM